MEQETTPKRRIPDLDLGTALHLGYAMLWYFDEAGLKVRTVTTMTRIKGRLSQVRASIGSHEVMISPADC
jgi:hypothetical protein